MASAERFPLCLLMLVFSAALGCGRLRYDPSTTPGDGGGLDAGRDAGGPMDASLDASIDAGRDGAPDAPLDAAVDSGADASLPPTGCGGRVATRIVSPTGSDGGDGLIVPWQTLQHAADSVLPGDVVVVEDGSYAGFTLSTSGTAVSPIYFCASGLGALTAPIRVENASYVEVSGFVVSGGARGISAGGASPLAPMEGIVFSRNTIIGSTEAGISLSNTSRSRASGNEIRSAASGIRVSHAGSAEVTVRNNRILASGGDGIFIDGDVTGGGDGIVRMLHVDGNFIEGSSDNAIAMDGVQGAIIENNLLVENGRHGIRGYRIGGGGGCFDYRIRNNTIAVVGAGNYAIKITEDAGEHAVFNNVLVYAGDGGGALSVEATATLRSASNRVADVFEVAGSIFSLRGWQGLGQGVGSALASPATLFTNSSIGDYTPAPGASTVDMGVPLLGSVVAAPHDIDGVGRPLGASVDIGAYER